MHVSGPFQVPQTTYKTPVEDDIISRIREENRRKAEVCYLVSGFTYHWTKVICIVAVQLSIL